MKKNNTPKDWQLNPEKVTSETVQFWSGGLLASQIPLDQARKMIETSNAFVISDIAIGLLTDGKMDS